MGRILENFQEEFKNLAGNTPLDSECVTLVGDTNRGVKSKSRLENNQVIIPQPVSTNKNTPLANQRPRGLSLTKINELIPEKQKSNQQIKSTK